MLPTTWCKAKYCLYKIAGNAYTLDIIECNAKFSFVNTWTSDFDLGNFDTYFILLLYFFITNADEHKPDTPTYKTRINSGIHTLHIPRYILRYGHFMFSGHFVIPLSFCREVYIIPKGRKAFDYTG